METKLNLYIVLYLLFAHWVADFIFQTDKMAKGKSSDNIQLLSHTVVYSSIMCFLLAILSLILTFYFDTFFHPIQVTFFTLITFVIHTIQDYITSRINTKLYNKGKIHEFFVSIGFDQFLHFVQLLLTYNLLFN